MSKHEFRAETPARNRQRAGESPSIPGSVPTRRAISGTIFDNWPNDGVAARRNSLVFNALESCRRSAAEGCRSRIFDIIANLPEGC